MSSTNSKMLNNTAQDQATVAESRAALEATVAPKHAAPQHAKSFAAAAAKPEASPARPFVERTPTKPAETDEPKEPTPAEKNAAWIERFCKEPAPMKGEKALVLFYLVRPYGEEDKPKSGYVEAVKKAIKTAGAAHVKVVSTKPDKDGRTNSRFIVIWHFSDRDAAEIEAGAPQIVSMPKPKGGFKDLYLHQDKSTKPKPQATARIGKKRAPSKTVDAERFVHGLPDMPDDLTDEQATEWLKGEKVPRCFRKRGRAAGSPWNALPGDTPKWCQKSGKHKDGYRGQSDWNREIFAKLRAGQKPTKKFAPWNHSDLYALGVSDRDDYAILQAMWLEDSAAMLEHDQAQKDKVAAKAKRAKARKEAATPDEDGFKVQARGKKAAPESKPAEPRLLQPSFFGALEVESEESEAEEEVPDSGARPDPAELEEPVEDYPALQAAAPGRKKRRNRGVRLDVGL